ncbi:AAA family ATPase [Pseudarthrobacter albicanus]|uniref:AAA family ATPase n=1 Tax=Pseudarthrobacter albicanus TaxID=2823873 RepID=UPI001BAA096C|nr:AAA family ATPase [Pseudarthrobacter albicanus]
MIITIGSLKGGVGKSTATVNAAAELTRLGYKTIVVDADPIGTTANWIGDREKQSPDHAAIIGIQKKGNLRSTLQELDTNYDVVLVDVGGYDSQEMRTAATSSDLLVVPMKPSPVDLDTLPQFVDLLVAFRDFNPELLVRGLFTQAPTHSMSKKLDDAKDILGDYPELPLFDTTMFQRSAYMDVMPLGRGVVEWSDSKAKAETQVLVQEMMSLA